MFLRVRSKWDEEEEEEFQLRSLEQMNVKHLNSSFNKPVLLKSPEGLRPKCLQESKLRFYVRWSGKMAL